MAVLQMNILTERKQWLVLLIHLLVFGIGIIGAQQPQPIRTHLIQLRVTEAQLNELEQMKFALATHWMDDSTALAVVSNVEMALLHERGYAFSVISQSDNERDLYKRALYGESMQIDPVYHTYEAILAQLTNLVQQQPGLIQLKKIGQTSVLKKDIWAVKISDHASQEEDEPAILFSGAIHSNELAGVEICMTLIRYLLENYRTDKRVASWINDYEIWFIPVINVDGHYVVTHNIDPRWRKNLRDNNRNGILYEPGDGVDLNRNFDYNWAHGGSSDSTHEYYRGEVPFSELECIAFRDLALAQKFLLSVTYHSQGEVIFYPWIWHGRKAPDDKLLTRMANGLASSIRTLKGDTTYQASYGAGTVGQTYPWLYGFVGTWDFIVETGLKRYIFPPAELNNIVASNLNGAFYMLEQMHGPGLTGHVRDADTGKPLTANVWFPAIDTEDVERRTSNDSYGRYFRLLEPGKYRVIFRKDGYQPQYFKAISVKAQEWTTLEVQLKKVQP